jgi:hypothetical protein
VLQLGVPLPSQREFITKGTVRHDRKGKIGISREEGNVTFSRSSLAQYLIGVRSTTCPAPQHVACGGFAVPGVKPSTCLMVNMHACLAAC